MSGESGNRRSVSSVLRLPDLFRGGASVVGWYNWLLIGGGEPLLLWIRISIWTVEGTYIASRDSCLARCTGAWVDGSVCVA